jgi:cation-transporting ATPase E
MTNMVKEEEKEEKKEEEAAVYPNTRFTNKAKAEQNQYKHYYDKVWKKRAKNPVTPDRFSPDAGKGLSAGQVTQRIDDCFVNHVKKGSTKTVGRILWTNIFSFFNILCFAVAGVLIYGLLEFENTTSSWTNLLFLLIIVTNILIGIIQELKAKYIIEKLSVVAGAKIVVIRDGQKYDLLPNDIVLDDVVMLSLGQQVPADGVVLDGFIEVNESLLTGESKPVSKKKGDTLLAGSFITAGTVKYRIEKVGKESYIQAMAKDASRYIRPRSELLRSLRAIIKVIGGIIVILSTIMIYRQVSGHDLTSGVEANEVITSTAGSIIGMIPAGMFLLTSLALAVGVINLAKSNTLVQELYCIEMLARVDMLCLDKTGTITDGTMKTADVIEIKNNGKSTLREIMSSMLYALDNNNQTSVALGDYFGHECVMKPKSVLPFSSARKLSAVTFDGAGVGTYIFGAPEFVLHDMNEKLNNIVTRLASQGYRVLVVAHSAGKINGDELPGGIQPVALITLQDSVRREAPQTIKWFRDNGVAVRVISGDNPVTVAEVARRAGIEGADKYISLAGLSASEVRAAANEYIVFGRVTPEQKLILIKEFKNAGRTVAMTGDGVNDILALREADCSIAMAAGSEAARNVSHLVLLDSNFASMPKVVLEGRRVVNNVQKSSSLFLFKTMFTILLTIFCIFAGRPYFFEPRNLILLEYFIIGIPCFALALERNSQLIKGKFILNILKNAFSGAIVVLINVSILYIFWKTNFASIITTEEIFRTMSVYAVLFTGFAMLYKMVQPLNVYRGVLLGLMTFFFGISVVYLSDYLGIVALDNIANILLIIVMAQAAFFLIAFINNMLAKMKLSLEDKFIRQEK